ncbi:IS200/IS605 family accessory protein TnpB-related protein [Streptomyces sp. NPDC127049]|uniref:IS200/IS605 family accessory protein TnpB-related protein n=1 Tax=Streptomyces sp. NPDC127049 TaxID=3347118 RepID=UPI0036563889
MVERSASGLRVLTPPRLVVPTGVITVRTRLRLSDRDAVILRELAECLSRLMARDLAERVALGVRHTSADFARRKRELTALTSSRWAGTITRGSNDQWQLARRAQAAHLGRLSAEIEAIERRLAAPVGGRDGAARIKGYPTQRVRAAKQQRLQSLRARSAVVAADAAAGRVHVVRGGREHLRGRLRLERSERSLQEWRDRWWERRTRIEADGEAGKTYGNQSLRVGPDGIITVKLPAPLVRSHREHCDRFGRYTLDARCRFAYRTEEWRTQVEAHRAVGYTVRFDRGRCFLTASFTPPEARPAVGGGDEALMSSALAGGVLGIDQNVDHLAVWRLDVCGNPVGRPGRIDVGRSGSASWRDAQVRHVCSELIRAARRAAATALVIEDLGFDTGRERCGWAGRTGRRFRWSVAGMPYARFMSRLVAMAHRAGLAVIAVDPAYTSRWGAQHWQRSTSTTREKTSRHEASAVVIGRRGQGLGARRRAEKPVPRRKTEEAGRSRVEARRRAGTENHRPAPHDSGPGFLRAPRTADTPEDGARDAPRRRTPTAVQAAQHRSGPPTGNAFVPGAEGRLDAITRMRGAALRTVRGQGPDVR